MASIFGVEETGATWAHLKWGSGGRAPSCWANFVIFFEKNSNFNTVWITFGTFLKPFETILTTKIKKPVEELNPFFRPSMFTGQLQAMLKRLHPWLNFVSNLAKGGGLWLKPLYPILLVAPLRVVKSLMR